MDRLTINSSKSVVLQCPAGRKTPSVDLQINGCVLDSEPTATHLGVLQGPARTINTQRIGTRTMYALFGAGLYGRNGFNPMVSAKIWTTYIRPRLLHNAELWCLNNTNTNILEKFITALQLTKYNLPAPEHMLYSTPTKGNWKTLLLSRIREQWYTHMYREASVKSSLRFLSEDTLNVTRPALVWRAALHSHRDTENPSS